MSSNANKFLMNLVTRTNTKATVTRVLSGSLIQSIASFNERVRQAAEGEQDYYIPVTLTSGSHAGQTILCSLSDYFEWQGSLGDDPGWVHYDTYDQAGNLVSGVMKKKSEIISLIDGELDVASIEAQIIPALSGLEDDVSASTAWFSVQGIFDGYVSEPAIRLKDYVRFSLLNGQDMGTDLQSLLISFIDKTSDEVEGSIFKPSTVGAYTGTNGWALLAISAYESVESFVQNLKFNFKITFASIVDAWDSVAILNARANMYAGRQISYWFSTWGQDEYVTVSSNKASGSDFSLSNGFVNLGGGFSAATVEQFHLYGLTQDTAICIHTLGATWYIYYGDYPVPQLGFVRHLYPQATANYLRRAIAATGNDWSNVESTLDGANFAIVQGQTGLFPSVARYNEYMLDSLERSSKLIPAGLLAISDTAIENRYYQDIDPAVTARYDGMFVKDRDASAEITRAVFIDSAMYPGNQNAKTLAFDSITDYFNKLASGSAGCAYCHTLETAQAPGCYRLMDDSLTKEARLTHIENVGKGIIAAAAVVLVAVASAKLKSAAFQAYVQAQRIIYDTSASLTDIRKANRKASVLARLSGLTTSVAAYTVSDGVSSFASSLTESQQESQTSLDLIKSLITG